MATAALVDLPRVFVQPFRFSLIQGAAVDKDVAQESIEWVCPAVMSANVEVATVICAKSDGAIPRVPYAISVQSGVSVVAKYSVREYGSEYGSNTLNWRSEIIPL